MIEKIQGGIVGLAIGDAIAFPGEFLSREQIQSKYGGIREFVSSPTHPAGTYSGDTQMSLAVAESLIEEERNHLDRLMNAISQSFVRWSESDENDRAPDSTCMAACKNLKSGIAWTVAGIPSSKGCGSNMRVIPIGMFYHYDLSRLTEVASLSCQITHRHPTVIASAVGTAVAASLLMNNTVPEILLETLIKMTRYLDSDYADKLILLKDILKLPEKQRPDEEVMRVLGEGWIAEDALANALYCFLKSPDNFEETVIRAANSDGDSDSIGCIAGGLSGIYNGIKGIPHRWVCSVEKTSYLQDVANRIFKAMENK